MTKPFGGRPKGSRNKLTLNLTKTVQEALMDECDVRKMVKELYDKLMDENTKPEAKARIFDTLLKYGAVQAHVNLTEEGAVVDNESRMIELMAYIASK